MESDYLTLQEAADLLGKSTQTVRRLIKRGDLQAQRLQTPQGFQYAVLRSSMTGRFVRIPSMPNIPSVNSPLEQPAVVHDPKPVFEPIVEPVGTDWSKLLTSQDAPSNEVEEAPEAFLENDYYLVEPSPVDTASVSGRQLLEFAQAAHKEKLMLITILERLQAELERERSRPKTLLQWIGNVVKSVFGADKK